MLSSAWQKHWIVKILPSKISILRIIKYYFEKPWPRCDSMTYDLIKYYPFQIIEINLDETPYVML